MFRLFSQLPRDQAELRDHIAALSTMTGSHEHEHIFDHLYGCLSILDSKSSSLLAFNSIIIAVFAIFMTGELGQLDWLLVNVGMGMIIVSCFLLLSVVWVHWSTTADLDNLAEHALILLSVRRKRTIRYRLAWYFAVISMMSLSVFLVARVVVRLL